MQFKPAIHKVFVQLKEAISGMSDKEYTQPSSILFDASVGQHVRHIIELFSCLEEGYGTGVVNYENHKRDKQIEEDRAFASQLLLEIFQQLDKPNISLLLESVDYENPESCIVISTNYEREVAYNLEHTIHHMALIRIGITDVSSVQLPNDFGVAYSTIKYNEQCAQ